MAPLVRSSSFTVFLDNTSPQKPSPQRAVTFSASSSSQFASGKVAPRPLSHNEKENIDPATGRLPTAAVTKKGKGKSKASSTANTSKTSVHGAQSLRPRLTPTRANTSPSLFRNPTTSSPLSAKSGSSTPNRALSKRRATANSSRSVFGLPTVLEHGDDETVTGRLIRARTMASEMDQLARDLTVKPLADLSEAFALVSIPFLANCIVLTSALANFPCPLQAHRQSSYRLSRTGRRHRDVYCSTRDIPRHRLGSFDPSCRCRNLTFSRGRPSCRLPHAWSQAGTSCYLILLYQADLVP